MLTGSDKDYRVTQHIQSETRQQAEWARLAQTAPDTVDELSRIVLVTKRRVVIIIAVALVLLALFVGYQHAHAQDNIDVGKGDLFPEAMLAYRVGNYHLYSENYERATEELTRAIELMPEWAFEMELGYAEMYWVLGEAQEGAGLYPEALASYQQFLALVGEQAAPWTVEKVQILSIELDTMLMADVRA